MRRSWWLSILACAVLDVGASKRGPQKVRVISDIHAGSCWQGNQSQLFEFLQQTAHDDIDVLVLNGDVYDFWLVPLDKPPPSLDQSISKGLDPSLGFDMARFRKLLQATAKSVFTLHEDAGNHDMWLNGSMAKKALGDTVINDVNVSWTDSTVSDWGVRFEHGHLHSLFNRVPPKTNKMPIGYFVTRSVASFACASQDRVSKWLSGLISAFLGTSVIDSTAVEFLKFPTVFRQLLYRILQTSTGGKIGVNMSLPVVGVVSADRIPEGGDESAKYTLQHFIDDYADTLERFVEDVGYAESAKLIAGDVVPGALDFNVGQGSVTESVIVLGHTHVPSLQVVSRSTPDLAKTPDVLVANAGAWVADLTGKPQHSYVDLVIDDIDEDYAECYTKADGSDYRGQVHTTTNGTPCRPFGVRSRQYKDAFGSVAFCRNLGDETQPWCFTGVFSWDYCAVGKPAVKCPHDQVRGAVKVTLWSFPNAKPLAEATRNASTGSRWSVKNNMASEEIQIVV